MKPVVIAKALQEVEFFNVHHLVKLVVIAKALPDIEFFHCPSSGEASGHS